MEADLTAAIVGCLAGLGGLFTAVATYFRNKADNAEIRSDRANTAAARDADSQKLHDDVEKLKFQSQQHKDNIGLLMTYHTDADKAINEFNRQLAVVLTRIDTIIDTLTDIKKSKRVRK